MIRLLAKFSLMGFVISLIACGGGDVPKRDLQKPVSVKTIVATVQPLSSQSAYSGTLEPIGRVKLSTKIMGWIEKIYFDEGEKVQKGSILVKLRSQDLEAKRAQAEAAISEAEAHYHNVQMNLRRIESLHEKNAATRKELDDMQAAFASAQAKKKTAQEMKKEVDELLGYAELTAPFAGIVARKMLEDGDLANPGQPILEIENTSQMKVVAKVPENEVRELQVGAPVYVHIAAANIGTNGDVPSHTVNKIVPSADPVSRQFDIHVLMDNSKGLIKSGMFARVSSEKPAEMALLVPQVSIFRRGQLEGLFVVDSKNKARLRWVRTGARTDGLVEVLSGLNPGEHVIVGAPQLLEGQSVEVTE